MNKQIKKIVNFVSHPQEYYPNFPIFKYHLLKAINKSMTKHGFINADPSQKDMFNWSLYNIHYRGEIEKESKSYTISLRQTDYIFTESKLKQADPKIKPLHENWRMIYETILQLNPSSVLELGCGNGMHLHNINVLAPAIKLYGLDRSEEQLKYLHESYPDLPARVEQADAAIPFTAERPTADLAFTQAVIMHIHSGDSHKTALANLFNSATKYVLLMEKMTNHRYMDDIKELWQEKKIHWDNLYFYYRESELTHKPYFMICSNVPLNYPILNDFEIMLK